MIEIIIGVAAFAVGYLIAKVLEKNNASRITNRARKRASSIRQEAETIRKEAEAIRKEAENAGESIKKEKILQAKERFIELRSEQDRKSTRLNSSHVAISYAVFCSKKK